MVDISKLVGDHNPYQRNIDFKRVKRAANGKWREILTSLGIGMDALDNRHSPCPGCDGKDRFRFDDLNGDGTFYCSQYGKQSGDGFALLQHVYNWDSKKVLSEVSKIILSVDGVSSSERVSNKSQKPVAGEKQTVLEQRLIEGWYRLGPIRDQGFDYLSARKCVVPAEGCDLRFAPSVKSHLEDHTGPALIALVTHAVTGIPMTLQTTWINPDGTRPCNRWFLNGHTTRDGVVRLSPDGVLHRTLAVAEGIETGLSLAHAFPRVFALLTAGNMERFPVLEHVSKLSIAVDNDDNGVGQKAALACATRWTQAGREVDLGMPDEAGQDINDVVRSLL
jgi:putative DNA primase/helicase